MFGKKEFAVKDFDSFGENVMKIMFVCHGNICRSPMAEFIFKKMINDQGRSNEFIVASSATSTEEIISGRGNPVYPPAKAELLKHGISCEGKRAVQLKKADYDNYDLFLCMDSNNIRNALRIFGGDPSMKVKKLMSYTGTDADVADPWYTGNFEVTYSDIVSALSHFLKEN